VESAAVVVLAGGTLIMSSASDTAFCIAIRIVCSSLGAGLGLDVCCRRSNGGRGAILDTGDVLSDVRQCEGRHPLYWGMQ
jgi:hypothetical protein